jgi:ribonuclease HI
MTEIIVHTDGGARGNPGPAAVGVVIESNGKIIQQFGKTIGNTTNNVAEYTAVIEALKWIRENYQQQLTDEIVINFYLDSALVVNQLNGIFKIKDSNLRNLFTEIRIKEQGINGKIIYNLVRRQQNTLADFQVNQALDNQ